MRRLSSFWDLYARCYDGLLEARPYRRLLDQAAQCVPVGTKVLLDAGCGTGNLLKTLSQRDPSIRLHGVDSSAAMLQRVTTKVPDAHLKQADLNSILPYPDSFFEVVTCLNVLYAVADPERTLTELNRVLKPGGVLIASGPLPNPSISRIIRAHAAEAGWLRTASLLGHVIALCLFNLIIVNRERTYHFLDRQSVRRIFLSDEIVETYARQNWFVCVVKDRDERRSDPPANESLVCEQGVLR